jgi:DNA-3-methyladenine glycosylase II
VTPERLTEVGQARLRQAGLTRQKARYCVELAGAVASRRLDLRAVSRADDDTAMTMLTRVTGVGPWTAECYLLMALRRPDVWPAGDIALATAAQEVKRLRRRPSPERLTELAEAWRPHRATAARLLWHHYLSRRANAML